MIKEDFFLQGNWIMSERIRAFDWSKNPLGPLDTWPICLKLYVSQILSHQFPMLLLWGPEFIQIHNDPFLFSRDIHEDPPVLGSKSAEFFKETWHLVRPMLEEVYHKGKSFYNEDQGFPDNRHKKLNLAYYTYSYSPLMNEYGEIQGIMVTSIETTDKVESFRKLEESEQIARLALESAEMGSYEYNYLTDKVISSESHSKILGVNGVEKIDEYRTLYYEDDLKIRDQAKRDAIKTGKLNYTARIKVKDEIRWIHALGNVLYDSDKVPVKLIGVIQDITEKKLFEEKILLANKKLQIANKEQKELQKQKDQFLQIASHELRTPLTAIKGFAQLVQEVLAENGHERESKMLEKLNYRIDHLHALVENLFDISKINSGKLDLNLQVVELTSILRVLAEDLRFTPIKHTLIEEYNFSAKVNVDRERIAQVVTNLLSNAVKYSPEGKEIRIRTRKLDDFIAVDIMDQGIGIEKDELEFIFDQFYRSKNLENSGIGGLGLGLFLSAQIVQRKGGKIWVESEVGKGSVFTFTLPIYKEA